MANLVIGYIRTALGDKNALAKLYDAAAGILVGDSTVESGVATKDVTGRVPRELGQSSGKAVPFMFSRKLEFYQNRSGVGYLLFPLEIFDKV